MSTFSCDVVKVKIVPHPNADQIEIAEVGLFQSIVRKNLVANGDLVVYIPEGAIVPENIMKACYAWDEVKGHGRLSGSRYDRVKAIKLRGVLSQGLIYPLPTQEGYVEGQDLSEQLNIKKYDPEMPGQFRGKIAGVLNGWTPHFDVENYKKYYHEFNSEDLVTITEKIHGCSCLIGVLPKRVIADKANPENFLHGQGYISTKRQSKIGVVINPNDLNNIYSKVIAENNYLNKLIDYYNTTNLLSLVIVGEIFGKGIQDLTYEDAPPTFVAFEGYWAKDKILFSEIPEKEFASLLEHLNIPRVPILYSGKYSHEKVLELNSGMSILAPKQIREGVVVRSYDGTKRQKYVSENYLLRKGSTTEYE